MSDLFHKDIPADFIDSVFDTMEAAEAASHGKRRGQA